MGDVKTTYEERISKESDKPMDCVRFDYGDGEDVFIPYYNMSYDEAVCACRRMADHAHAVLLGECEQ